MALVDYERAWLRLQALVASKTQHGREGLLSSMATIASECQIPECEKAALLRLYSIEVQADISPSDTHDDCAGDSLAGATARDRATFAHRKEHDGNPITAQSEPPSRNGHGLQPTV